MPASLAVEFGKTAAHAHQTKARYITARGGIRVLPFEVHGEQAAHLVWQLPDAGVLRELRAQITAQSADGNGGSAASRAAGPSFSAGPTTHEEGDPLLDIIPIIEEAGGIARRRAIGWRVVAKGYSHILQCMRPTATASATVDVSMPADVENVPLDHREMGMYMVFTAIGNGLSEPLKDLHEAVSAATSRAQDPPAAGRQE